jgi:hypothetical protein
LNRRRSNGSKSANRSSHHWSYDMSVAGAALLGAAILALVALVTSLGTRRRAGARSQALANEALKTVVAAGLATGFCFIALAIIDSTRLLPEWAEMGALLTGPVLFLLANRLAGGWRRAKAAPADAGPVTAH